MLRGSHGATDAGLTNAGCNTAVLLWCWLLGRLVVLPSPVSALGLNPTSLLLFSLLYVHTAKSHLFICQCKHKTDVRNFHSCHCFQKQNNCCKLLYKTCILFFQNKSVAVLVLPILEYNHTRIAIAFSHARSQKRKKLRMSGL